MKYGWRAGAKGQGGREGRRAFSLVELLVVLGILGILGALLLSGLAGGRGKGWTAKCESNLRQLTVALKLYADDQQGAFPLNADTGDLTGLTGGWVSGNMSKTAEARDPQWLTRRDAALLAGYVGVAGVYACPADRSGKVRSYALNGRVAPYRNPTNGPVRWIGGRGTNFATYRGPVEMGRPERIFLLVDERADTINDGSFATDFSHTGNPLGLGLANPYYWIDFPADRHGGGAALSFADGHVVVQRWVEPTTRPGLAVPRTHTSSGDRDVQWLLERTAEAR